MTPLKALLASLMMISGSSAWAEACREDVVQLRSDGSELRFQVELADTPQERSRGLMFRESLPPRAGMLFVYEQPQRAAFWMKNTLIPLDMIFVDVTGTVTHVHHQAIPGDLTAIEGGTGVFSVLEINGGLARKYGIAPGSVLRHEVFSDGPAAWSC